MKNKNLIIPVVLLGLVAFLTMAPALTAQEEQQAVQEQKVVIPDQVRTVLQQGAQTRQPRLDIPFSILDKNLYLPAQANLHRVVFFKVKNADLGFVEPVQPAAKKEEAQEVTSFESKPNLLQSRNYVFLHYQQLDGNFAKEVYIPLSIQVDGSSYDAEKEEIYTTGYPLPPGNYLLSMAIASPDLQKIGTQYYEFTLPDPMGYTEELGITPVFFIKKLDRMSAPETRSEIHRGIFVYSVLQVETNLDHVFTAGDNLDVFFFVFGAQANQQGRNDIEVTYEVVQSEEKIIRYAVTNYDMALVSQPLPLKKTVLIKTTKEGQTTERQEQRDLEPGNYALSISINDKLSGKTLNQLVNFEVK
ncbi:MAG: hypothetical protein ACERK6_12255 [Candidatus Aminicenantaceae bacterium]